MSSEKNEDENVIPDGPTVKALFERKITDNIIIDVFNKVKTENPNISFGNEIIFRQPHLRSGIISQCSNILEEIKNSEVSKEFQHVALLVTSGNGLFFLDHESNHIDDLIDLSILTWEDWLGMKIHPVCFDFLDESTVAYTILTHMTLFGDTKNEVNGRVASKILLDALKLIENI
jgi:hypothetical protein